MSITIKDVAKKARVSVATVSRVLNKKANVSDEAAKAVHRAVKTLGYRPNYLGRDLRKSETMRILAIIASFEHSFYSEVLKGMEAAAIERGYDVLIATTHNDAEHELHLLHMLFSRSVDGAVILGPKLDAATISKLSQSHNVAMCIERLDDCNTLTVTIDNVKAGFDATAYLIGKGRRRVALITTEQRSQSSIDREKGYFQALEAYGIPVRPEYIYYGSYDYASGAQGCNTLLDLAEPPDAVFSISDTVALGAMHAAMQRGYEVGRDILFFGFDNISYASMFLPHLSTVEQPCFLQGRIVVEKLIDNMKSEKQDRSLFMLPHRLILRESTGD